MFAQNNFDNKQVKLVRAITNLPLKIAIKVVEEASRNKEESLEEIAMRYLQENSKKLNVKLEKFAIGFNVVGTYIKNNIAKIIVIGCGTDFTANSLEFKDYCVAVLEKIQDSDYEKLNLDSTLLNMHQKLQAACQEPIKLLECKILHKTDDERFVSYIYKASKIADNEYINFCTAATILKVHGNCSKEQEIAQHIVGNDITPVYVEMESIPDEIKQEILNKIRHESEGKHPEDKFEMIVQNKCCTYFKSIVLAEQVFIKDPTYKVRDIFEGLTILDFIAIKV